MLLLLNLAACPPLARSADLPQPEYYRWGAQLQVAAAAAEAHRIASSGAAHKQAGLQEVSHEHQHILVYIAKIRIRF